MRAFVSVVVAAGLVGCAGGPPPPTDPSEGAALLRSVLDAWRAGEKPAALLDWAPAVVAVDPSWSGGARLVRFEIDEAGAQPSGYDLSCPATLWLGDGSRPVKVRYVVALSPKKVVTREVGG